MNILSYYANVINLSKNSYYLKLIVKKFSLQIIYDLG